MIKPKTIDDAWIIIQQIRIKISIKFIWYDFWVGVFWDNQKRILYVCPFPMIVIIFKFRRKTSTQDAVDYIKRCSGYDKEWQDYTLRDMEKLEVVELAAKFGKRIIELEKIVNTNK